jgi:hypothetical protein
MAKERRFPDKPTMELHEEKFRRWLADRGVLPRKHHSAIARGLFCWPQFMAELCEEAGMEPPPTWLIDIYTLNVICITQYGIAATRLLKYHRQEPPKQGGGSVEQCWSVSPMPWRAWLLLKLFKLFRLTSFPDWFFWL